LKESTAPLQNLITVILMILLLLPALILLLLPAEIHAEELFRWFANGSFISAMISIIFGFFIKTRIFEEFRQEYYRLLKRAGKAKESVDKKVYADAAKKAVELRDTFSAFLYIAILFFVLSMIMSLIFLSSQTLNKISLMITLECFLSGIASLLISIYQIDLLYRFIK